MLIFADFGILAPLTICLMGVLMVVLRAGASRVYFDVVGTFQAERMLKDAEAMSTTMNALMLDAFSGLEEAAQVLGEPLNAMIDSLIPITREVANATIEFQKFVQEGEDTDRVTQAVHEIGLAYGFAADEALHAAARMAQLGGILGPGMVGEGTEMGIRFGLISGMETEAAMQRMVNLQQQTKFMTDGLSENMTEEERAMKIRVNSMHVLDQLNTVENRSAATMSQVTYVMNQFASQAHLTGESIAYMAAMSATLIEAGEEQGKGGRALRMIYARLGADTGGAATALHELGIATTTVEGNLRPLSEILRDLSRDMEGKSGAEKQAIAQAVAGNRHYVRLIKLMENFGRVEQLAAEATLAMSPAMEEINRRLEANIFALDQAEARLYNYQATLGDLLIPGLTAATERQADFTLAMGELSSGWAGNTINTLLEYLRVISNIAGPMIQATISLKQFTVANQTYSVLQRAIAGEELVRADFVKRMGAEQQNYTQAMHENIAAQQGYKQAMKELNMEEARHLRLIQQITQTKANAARDSLLSNVEQIQASKKVTEGLLRHKIAIQEKIMSLKELGDEEIEALARKEADLHVTSQSIHAAYRKGEQTKIIKGAMKGQIDYLGYLLLAKKNDLKITNEEIEAIRNLNYTREQQNQIMRDQIAMHFGEKMADQIMKMRLEAEEEAKVAKENMEMMKARTNLISQFAVATMAASSVLTLFGKGERSARAAIVLTTMSMVPYILSMIAAAGASETDAAAKGYAALMGAALGVSNIFAAGTYAALAEAAATAAAAIAAFAAIVGAMIIVGLVVAEIAVAVGLFDESFKDLNSTLQTASMMDATNILKFFNQGLSETQARLDEIANPQGTGALDVYMAAWGDGNGGLRDDVPEDTKRIIEALQLEEMELQRAADLLTQQGILHEGNVDKVAKNVRAFQDLNAEVAKHYGLLTAVHRGYLDKEVAQQRILQDQEDMNALLEDTGISQEDFNTLLSLGLTDTEKILAAWQQLEGMPGATSTGVIAITDELRLASDAMYDFAGAREELFFGFAAGNVTGDLVKQVKKTGVENLLVNTEVIMHNNFNGMTTNEVANEILTQIERRAGSLTGISFTS